MSATKFKQSSINIEIDTTELNDSQVRLVKSINTMLSHILTTDDECDYFDGSSDLMKLVANAIKNSNFSTEWAAQENIEYAKQAIEFSVDILADQVSSGEFAKYDN